MRIGYIGGVAAAILAVAVAVALWGGWGLLAQAQIEPLHRDADVVAMGQSLYDENCASCHAADLSGHPNWREAGADGKLPAPPHDETGHTWHHPTGQLFAITKYGSAALVGGGYQSNMAAFEDVLSDEEILAVLAYIKSTWPEQIIARHDQMDAAQGN